MPDPAEHVAHSRLTTAVVVEQQRAISVTPTAPVLLTNQGGEKFLCVIGPSRAYQELFDLVRKAVCCEVNTLIMGETGTGKEIVARMIHTLSPRKNKPFVVQNCAALPETLLESELFGFRRGTFTGATHDKKGLVDAAQGGTLFLDEVDALTLPLQAKLLRIVEVKEVRALGEVQTRKVDLRIIAAPNGDLRRAVESKAFREDLYYRLNVFSITVPPLRERREDIPILIDHFLWTILGKHTEEAIEARAVERLLAWNWPGNVRELQNVLQRAAILAVGRRISGDDLPHYIPEAVATPEPPRDNLEGNAVAHDITKQPAEEALRRIQERFRHLTETIPEIFWFIEPRKRNPWYVSPAGERIYGVSAAEFRKNPQIVLELIHPDDQPRILPTMMGNFREPYDLEYRIVRPDGQIRRVRSRSFPSLDEDGELVRITGFTEDITECKHAEQHQRESEAEFQAGEREHLREKLAALRRERMLGAISRAGGNKSVAAKRLGMSRSNLYYFLRKRQ